MKRITAFLGMMVCASLCAQEAKIPPLPTGPLLKRMPDYSVWSVVIQGTPIGSGSGMGAASGEAPPRLAQAKVIKTGSIIQELNTNKNGQIEEIWHLDGVRIMKLPDAKIPLVSPDSAGGGDIYSVNFSVSDFAGLDWISPNTYVGIEKYKGRDCIIFRDTVSPLTSEVMQQQSSAISSARADGREVPNEIKVPAVAYIDLETRLPIYAEFGQEKRSYGYGDPPKAKLSLPMDLSGALKEYILKIKRLSAPASRPY
jgi:hypothetical protein